MAARTSAGRLCCVIAEQTATGTLGLLFVAAFLGVVSLPQPTLAQVTFADDELNPERWSSPFLEADRDAFTPATTTVGKGIKLLESSYAYIDNRHDADIHSLPETLLRYGLTDRIELRVGFNYEAGGGGNVVTANESSEGLIGRGVEDESYMLYGAKIGMTRQRGWIPESSFILEGFTPTGGHESATKPVVTYTAGWKFQGGWELDSAIRYAMGNEHEHGIFARWAPSVVLRYSATEKLQVHLEYFGVYTEGLELDTSRAFLSPGGRYLITPNFELGLRVGWGISYDAAYSFVNTGFGWRF
jgi:hypothetical protein